MARVSSVYQRVHGSDRFVTRVAHIHCFRATVTGMNDEPLMSDEIERFAKVLDALKNEPFQEQDHTKIDSGYFLRHHEGAGEWSAIYPGICVDNVHFILIKHGFDMRGRERKQVECLVDVKRFLRKDKRVQINMQESGPWCAKFRQMLPRWEQEIERNRGYKERNKPSALEADFKARVKAGKDMDLAKRAVKVDRTDASGGHSR